MPSKTMKQLVSYYYNVWLTKHSTNGEHGGANRHDDAGGGPGGETKNAAARRQPAAESRGRPRAAATARRESEKDSRDIQSLVQWIKM